MAPPSHRLVGYQFGVSPLAFYNGGSVAGIRDFLADPVHKILGRLGDVVRGVPDLFADIMCSIPGLFYERTPSHRSQYAGCG